MIESTVHIKWAAEVADHDYAAAEAYLSLKLSEDAVAKAIRRLRKGALTTRRANDILRAAGADTGTARRPRRRVEFARPLAGE